jgi:hypothetical protein
MTKRPLNSGTTVVELILYIGLLSIFILLLFNLFSSLLSSQTRSVAVSLIQTNGNFILTKLTHDINQADSIVSPATLDTPVTTMTLKNGTNNVTYSVVDKRLVLSDATGNHNLNDVDTTFSNFIVRRLGNTGGKQGLEISFTITSNVTDNSNIKTKDFNIFATTR